MREYRVKTRVELSTGIPEGKQDPAIFEKTRKQMPEKIAGLIKGNDLLLLCRRRVIFSLLRFQDVPGICFRMP